MPSRWARVNFRAAQSDGTVSLLEKYISPWLLRPVNLDGRAALFGESSRPHPRCDRGVAFEFSAPGRPEQHLDRVPGRGCRE